MRFDENKDLMPVDQVGFLNLRESYVSGSIGGDFNISDESFNRAPPDSMMHRPDDVFASYRQRDYVKSSLAAQAQPETVTD